MKKESELPDNSPDLTNFIRSIQKLEGNPGCFGTANGKCDRLDCAWRIYCLDKMYAHPKKTTQGDEHAEIINFSL